MHTPLHGIAREGVTSTSYSISYDVTKMTLELPVIIHDNPLHPSGGGNGRTQQSFYSGRLCLGSISIASGRKLNKTQ